jgi:hypothetical protein
VYALDALFWKPIENASMSCPWSDLQSASPAICMRPKLRNAALCKPQSIQLVAYRSPLQRDSFKLLLYATIRPPLQSRIRRLLSPYGPGATRAQSILYYSYHFKAPRDQVATLRMISVVPAAYFSQGAPWLAYSGYGSDPSTSTGYIAILDARLERDGVTCHRRREVLKLHMGLHVLPMLWGYIAWQWRSCRTIYQ